MRRAILLGGAILMLIVPTVLAFFSGGYFETSRLIALLGACALVLVSALLSPRPLPSSRGGWVAAGGLALLLAWSAVSVAWAPIGGPAVASVELVALYLAALLAAVGLLRERAAAAAAEPILALGALVVIGYGLAGRLLPGVIELERTVGAGERLEQPLTYWNATGALAAVGLVLCARLVGDRARPLALRATAAAATAPLGVGVYLSYSRGALAAAIVGLIVLLAAAPSRAQLRGVGVAVVAAGVAAGASAAFPGVASLAGSASARERDGAIVLAILLAVMLAAALAAAWVGRSERRARLREGRLGFARVLPLVAGAAVALALAGLVVAGLNERGNSGRPAQGDLSTGANRLASVESNRYEYWRVALGAFRREPVQGTGAGGYGVEWLRERRIDEGVRQAHSLPLETAAELGLPGLLALVVFVLGVAAAARRALRRSSPLAAGGLAACAAWGLHASIDWGWQMPAVTLPLILLAGALVAAGEAERGSADGNEVGAREPTGTRLRALGPAHEPANA